MPLDYRNRAKLPQDVREAFDDVLGHVQNVMDQTNTSPSNAKVLPPPDIQSLNVTSSGGIHDAMIVDNASPVTQHVEYYLEHSSSPSFSQPHIVPLGASRNYRTAAFGNQNLYFRAYSKYKNSVRNSPVYHGGTPQNSLVRGSGTTSGPVIQPSQGAGTMSGASGSDGGNGNLPYRGPSRPVTVGN